MAPFLCSFPLSPSFPPSRQCFSFFSFFFFLSTDSKFVVGQRPVPRDAYWCRPSLPGSGNYGSSAGSAVSPPMIRARSISLLPLPLATAFPTHLARLISRGTIVYSGQTTLTSVPTSFFLPTTAPPPRRRTPPPTDGPSNALISSAFIGS